MGDVRTELISLKYFRGSAVICLSALVWLLNAQTAPCADAKDARSAAERGLKFLEADVTKWRSEHECATCHHGTMTVWAFSEAIKRGLMVDRDTSSEIIHWTKQRFMERIDQPRDPRPGWKMVSTPAIYLSLTAQCVDGQQAVTPEELSRIDRHLLRHQESDGSWAWSSAPPINRPPPFFESDEVATRLVLTALEGRERLNPDDAGAIRAGREKARQWLAQTPPETTTQAVAIRLLMNTRMHESPETTQPLVAELLRLQNEDGGWGQLDNLPSDAYATGQSLYVLAQSGLTEDRPEVLAAVGFLLRTQREDGSWPMTSRAHPGAEPYKNPVPITYFGSAWGTLGLLQIVPQAERP